jgi:hypothetical protein
MKRLGYPGPKLTDLKSVSLKSPIGLSTRSTIKATIRLDRKACYSRYDPRAAWTALKFLQAWRNHPEMSKCFDSEDYEWALLGYWVEKSYIRPQNQPQKDSIPPAAEKRKILPVSNMTAL